MKPITSEQLAGMNMHYQRHSFDYFLNSMQRVGIKRFELWSGAPHLYPFIASLSDIGKLRREVQSRNLEIVCVTPEQVLYPYNIAAADPDLRSLSLDYFNRHIAITAELGVDKMLCCSGWGNYDEDREEAWKRAVDGLVELANSAKKNGIKLAFEILGPQETNLVSSLESTRRIMNEIQLSEITLCVDTVPVKVENYRLADFFEIFGKRISHIHLTDGNPAGHVAYGMGSHDLDEHLDALSQFEYDGSITLELGDLGYTIDPERYTKQGFDHVSRKLPFCAESRNNEEKKP